MLTPAQEAKYGTDREFVLDVHMSHNMEFAYPQGMNNCVTCHEGKLNQILTPGYFTFKTCRSCHAIDNLQAKATAGWATHPNVTTANCALCHDGATAKAITEIHTGYNPVIFAADGTKYADAITVSIDSASIAANTLSVAFSASGTAGGLLATDIVPTIYISLYGYNTKDFIVSNHDRDAALQRIGEFTFDGVDANTNFANAVIGSGSWSVDWDMTPYAAMIADGSVKRLEIAVAPGLQDANLVSVGLNAPSKTFNIAANAFETYFSPIVDANKCNTCHAQLATTFHSPDRGGNVVVCRMCHTPKSGGSHLEMQSRSIDSYVHAIHSFQAFDPGDIANDTLSAMRYNHHIESTYPNFTITNCESCHNPGTYNVPDQSKSMPGKFSAADVMAPGDLLYGRNIGAVPSYDAGPASRACGSCHRSELINEDKAGELAAFNQHTKTNGYLVKDATGVLDKIISGVMSKF